MHCNACEVMIERKFLALPGVTKAKANQAGWVKVWSSNEPDIVSVNEQIGSQGYQIFKEDYKQPPGLKRTAGILLIILASYFFLRQFNLAPNLSAGDELSLGVVFIMGLVAAVSSCMAVTGGLLVAVSAGRGARDIKAKGIKKIRPHIYFNLGRLIGYAFFGAVIGAIGSALGLSPVVSGLVTLLASLAMIILGLRLLEIFPWLAYVSFKPPKFIAHHLYDAAGNSKGWALLLLGAGTFFLPCGFTQALQLYVLTVGGAAAGASIMLVFALGTLPALFGLGLITSLIKGRGQKLVSIVAGVAVVALGLINFGYGANLVGLSAKYNSIKQSLKISADERGLNMGDHNVTMVDGIQVVKMDVVARGYSPNHFTIREGLPVRWEINGVNTYGCQSMLQFPAINVTKYIKPGVNIIEFTAQGKGQLPFHCAMGMYTGSFTVLAKD